MLRRIFMGVVIGASALGAIGYLIACGYLALPGGWTVNFPGFTGDPLPAGALQRHLSVPPGFFINVYAGGIENARLLLFTDAGDLLVSAPRQGKVFLLSADANGDGVADGQRVLLDHLYQPHGLAYRDGWLYVAETTAVLRIRFDPATGTVHGDPERLIRDLPDGGTHWTRTIHIGPDGKLYVSIGSSCNVCVGDGTRRAAILRFNLDGSGEERYATGLRNAVDFAWQPGTGDLYATDNGRDLLGDDFPPDELDRIVPGGFYGWPFANGDRVPDPDYGKGHEREIAASIRPAYDFPAHVATLGITFYEPPGGPAPATFPERYRGAAFVAQHGSWNRSKKIGYRVVALHFDAGGTITEEPFATGFMIDEKVYGRPVGAAVGPDAHSTCRMTSPAPFTALHTDRRLRAAPRHPRPPSRRQRARPPTGSRSSAAPVAKPCGMPIPAPVVMSPARLRPTHRGRSSACAPNTVSSRSSRFSVRRSRRCRCSRSAMSNAAIWRCICSRPIPDRRAARRFVSDRRTR